MMDAVLVVFGRHQQDRKVKVADKPGMSVGAQEGNHFFFKFRLPSDNVQRLHRSCHLRIH